MHARIEAEFTGRGSILTKLPSYEKRAGQLEMALAVADTLENKANLMVEAGTGIGKSFAYLIPLIYWTMKEGRKAVVATGTKVLQNQLVAKDLPFLAENSDVAFKYEVLYGQENFFCGRRAGMITQYGLFDDPDQAEEFQKIAEWVREGSGIFEDYPEPISSKLKQQISRRSEACPRRNCAYYTECPYYRKRRAIEEADIIVINHHLFFAHLESAGKLLPEFGAAVFDEALGLTGLVLTKLDGTARGGIVVAIARELAIPVRFVGLGEGIDDIEPFDASTFARGLLRVPAVSSETT